MSKCDRSRPIDRLNPPSADLLEEIHVYIVPLDGWIPYRKLAKNDVVDETISAGFARVSRDTTLSDFRPILKSQLGIDIPKFYVFIKSVGRNFTQVKTSQEGVLKVKHFLPPRADEPEIHILEINKEYIKDSGSVQNLLISDSELSDYQERISKCISRNSLSNEGDTNEKDMNESRARPRDPRFETESHIENSYPQTLVTYPRKECAYQKSGFLEPIDPRFSSENFYRNKTYLSPKNQSPKRKRKVYKKGPSHKLRSQYSSSEDESSKPSSSSYHTRNRVSRNPPPCVIFTKGSKDRSIDQGSESQHHLPTSRTSSKISEGPTTPSTTLMYEIGTKHESQEETKEENVGLTEPQSTKLDKSCITEDTGVTCDTSDDDNFRNYNKRIEGNIEIIIGKSKKDSKRAIENTHILISHDRSSIPAEFRLTKNCHTKKLKEKKNTEITEKHLYFKNLETISDKNLKASDKKKSEEKNSPISKAEKQLEIRNLNMSPDIKFCEDDQFHFSSPHHVGHCAPRGTLTVLESDGTVTLRRCKSLNWLPERSPFEMTAEILDDSLHLSIRSGLTQRSQSLMDLKEKRKKEQQQQKFGVKEELKIRNEEKILKLRENKIKNGKNKHDRELMLHRRKLKLEQGMYDSENKIKPAKTSEYKLTKRSQYKLDRTSDRNKHGKITEPQRGCAEKSVGGTRERQKKSNEQQRKTSDSQNKAIKKQSRTSESHRKASEQQRRPSELHVPNFLYQEDSGISSSKSELDTARRHSRRKLSKEIHLDKNSSKEINLKYPMPNFDLSIPEQNLDVEIPAQKIGLKIPAQNLDLKITPKSYEISPRVQEDPTDRTYRVKSSSNPAIKIPNLEDREYSKMQSLDRRKRYSDSDIINKSISKSSKDNINRTKEGNIEHMKRTKGQEEERIPAESKDASYVKNRNQSEAKSGYKETNSDADIQKRREILMEKNRRRRAKKEIARNMREKGRPDLEIETHHRDSEAQRRFSEAGDRNQEIPRKISETRDKETRRRASEIRDRDEETRKIFDGQDGDRKNRRKISETRAEITKNEMRDSEIERKKEALLEKNRRKRAKKEMARSMVEIGRPDLYREQSTDQNLTTRDQEMDRDQNFKTRERKESLKEATSRHERKNDEVLLKKRKSKQETISHDNFYSSKGAKPKTNQFKSDQINRSISRENLKFQEQTNIKLSKNKFHQNRIQLSTTLNPNDQLGIFVSTSDPNLKRGSHLDHSIRVRRRDESYMKIPKGKYALSSPTSFQNYKRNILNEKDLEMPQNKEEIEKIRSQKAEFEAKRKELFERARRLHEQILIIKEQKLSKSKKMHTTSRREGVELEERLSHIRHELESLYRKYINSFVKIEPIITGVRDLPSRKANLKIMAIRLRHEIADVKRRVETGDIKLQAEIKLRQQAEREVKQLRNEVSRKKANFATSKVESRASHHSTMFP